MPFLAIFLLILCFLKTFYYGIYEFKTNKNKPRGIAVCLYSILRTYISNHNDFYLLYIINYSPLPSGNAG